MFYRRKKKVNPVNRNNENYLNTEKGLIFVS